LSIRVQPSRVAAAAGHRGVLVWKWSASVIAVSSAPVGGGIGPVDWALNIGVGSDYSRTDLSGHAAEITADLGLSGSGAAMFTAVDLDRLVGADGNGVSVDATVGISHPTWAVDPAEVATAQSSPGTINLVVQVPVALDPGAAVNAVMTATEAKAQALADRGVPGTGTATDAVIVVWPEEGAAERFAGPRSQWGSRIGRAVYQAVWAGSRAWSMSPPVTGSTPGVVP